MANNRSLVRQVAVKQDNGKLGDKQAIGALFTDVVDDVRDGATQYSLAQFLDNYMDFMESYPFTYMGDTEPTNPNVKIWIDTSSSNL